MTRLRTGIIGIGGRGAWLVQAVSARPDCEIVGLADAIPAKARYLAEQIGRPELPVCASIEELLGTECDVVMVTTPDAHHAEIVLPALAAGKTVFCEKPLETTLDRCRAIIEADARAGGRTFVGFNLRYAPVYATRRAHVERGDIGRILTIQADEFYDGGRTYFRRWNRLRSEGGGLWITKASHDFDLIAWLANAAPLEICAMAEKTYYVPRTDAADRCRDCQVAGSCPDRAPADVPPLRRLHEEQGGEPYDLCLYNSESDTFDHGIATIRLEGDIFATYTCNVVAGFSNRRIRISGTRGTLTGDLHGNTIELCRRDPAAVETIPVGGDLHNLHGGADENVLASFFAFARGEAEPRCRPREAAIAVRMGLAATRASDEHRLVRLGEFAL